MREKREGMTQKQWEVVSECYKRIASNLARSISDAYQREQNERQFTQRLPIVQRLPMLVRNWQISFVEAKRVFVFLEYIPGYFVPYGIHFRINIGASELVDIDDTESIAKLLKLGEIIDSRIFPFDVLRFDPSELMKWGAEWGTKLANEHMARTHPSFEEAKERMVDAYRKLFELEQIMRAFVENVLQNKHGTSWWNTVPLDVRNQVEKREKDATTAWFDDYSLSRFKFADFDCLRRTILQNWQDFASILGDKDLFHSQMVYLARARDRIAHINTLSADDAIDFMSQAARLLNVVSPHVQLR
jgi:hypothetical protein